MDFTNHPPPASQTSSLPLLPTPLVLRPFFALFPGEWKQAFRSHPTFHMWLDAYRSVHTHPFPTITHQLLLALVPCLAHSTELIRGKSAEVVQRHADAAQRVAEQLVYAGWLFFSSPSSPPSVILATHA